MPLIFLAENGGGICSMTPRKRAARDSTSVAIRVTCLRLGGGIAFGVVGVGGEAEADRAFVGFFRGSVELRETREIAGDERKDAGGHGIEGAEVADGTFAENAAGAVDHVVRGKSGGLVDDEDGVHWGWCN